MTAVAALLVRPDGTAAMLEVEPDLEALQGLVGGYLEAIHPADPSFGEWHAYIDEEAALRDVPENPAATGFAASIGWGYVGRTLRGPVVFLSSTPDGEEADVPPEVVGQAVRVWGLE